MMVLNPKACHQLYTKPPITLHHLPTLPLLVSVRLTWLCFQLLRREPLLCKLQWLHLYTSWQPPLTFYHIHPHCPPRTFQRCLHGSRCNRPKHRQKCNNLLLFKIYSSKVYIEFICFSLPELLLSSPTKKEIDMPKSYRNLKDEAMQ